MVVKKITNKLLHADVIVRFENGVKRMRRTVMICASTMLVTTNLLAADVSDAEQLHQIYDYSGIHAHLSWVLSTVQQEAVGVQDECPNQEVLPNLDSALEELLSEDALKQSFMAELEQRTNAKQRDEILTWATSEAGKQIYQVEADSINLDESQFNAMVSTYKDSDENTEERSTRMRNMLADTGAVYLISALNTETSALVAMASVCSTSAEDIESGNSEVLEGRDTEPFYRAFMRQELVLPSSIVYQDISDEDIDAYSEFAKSDAGSAYFSALIKGVRAVLAKRVDEITLTLKQL